MRGMAAAFSGSLIGAAGLNAVCDDCGGLRGLLGGYLKNGEQKGNGWLAVVLSMLQNSQPNSRLMFGVDFVSCGR
ncbi:hypothetical protein H9Q10_05450 [Eikenella sp. S3360]|uniref:Secreted protein n=1 Tax=Eikenella glucosivorans TaxID=2766967 RepID=A0ABS0N9Z1_9NEIS|nr:hypothetical protein [Eikenella glucosivorans]MBH5329111.1 hypothetical protein [Eikenella glucosivorans]